MTPRCDVLIIGGGVLGTAIAARLSQTSARVILIEQENDIADAASKGNMGIATCFYGTPNSLEAQMITASVPLWEDLCRRLDVPFKRLGMVATALTNEEYDRLPELLADAEAYGARAEVLTADQAQRLEPLISPQCRGALYLPDEAIIDPFRLTWGYAELAAANGVHVRLSTRLLGFENEGDNITRAYTSHGPIEACFVVNASGVFAGMVSGLAHGDDIRMWPRRGQYWILDRAFGARMTRIVRSIPNRETHGIQVAPSTNGSVLIGPDALDQEDPFDASTETEALAHILTAGQRLVPSISADYAIKTFAGIRPASKQTFRTDRDTRIVNLVHVGSRSNGVSASPAVAERTLMLLQQAGLVVEEREDAASTVPHVPRLLWEADPESLAKIDPLYGQVICACEQVTAAEITAALTSHVPAPSIEGVRKRTRATGGRCQGAVCMAGVAFLCTLHTGCEPYQVHQGPAGATLGIASETA